MCEGLNISCEDCKKRIWKGHNTFLYYRNGKYWEKKGGRSSKSRGKSGWYCNECAEKRLKNDPIIDTTKSN